MVEISQESMARQISPLAKPAPLPCLEGRIKIRLIYLTYRPKHVRNVMLRLQGVKPPFFEEIHILIPQNKVFTLIEAYLPAFGALKSCGLLDPDAIIHGFKILEEDEITLAYVI